MTREERIKRNFREAARLRSKREAAERQQQAADAARVPELESRVYRMEQANAARVAMPDDILERVTGFLLHRAADELSHQLAPQLHREPWFPAFRRAAADVMRGAVSMSTIRSDDHSIRVELVERVMDGSVEATLHIPDFKISYNIDRHEIRDHRGSRHRPFLRDGRPMYRLKDAPLADYSLVDPNAPVEVEYETF